jgi:hypothetical protein
MLALAKRIPDETAAILAVDYMHMLRREIGIEPDFHQNEAAEIDVKICQISAGRFDGQIARYFGSSVSRREASQLLLRMRDFLSFNRIIDNWPDNTAAHQRARLLGAMRVSGGVTTLEAVRFFDIVDPRARIVELRKEGYRINPSWVHQPTECGRPHAVGLYALSGNVEGVAITRASKTSREAPSQQMRLALW